MVQSLDTTSDQIPDYLLKDLFDKTNWKEVFLDKVLMVELFYALYTVYRFLKGLPEKDLSETEFNDIFFSWRVLIGLECLGRANAVNVAPFKIFDFDNLPNMTVDLKLDKTTLQAFMN